MWFRFGHTSIDGASSTNVQPISHGLPFGNLSARLKHFPTNRIYELSLL